MLHTAENSIGDVNFAISARSEQPEDGLLQRRGYTSEWIRRCLQAHLDRTRASNLQQTGNRLRKILERQQAGTTAEFQRIETVRKSHPRKYLCRARIARHLDVALQRAENNQVLPLQNHPPRSREQNAHVHYPVWSWRAPFLQSLGGEGV